MSIKDVRSQGVGGFVQCGYLRAIREGSSSDADVRTFWYKKLQIFRNLWCVRTDKGGRGLSQYGHFADKGRWRVNFSRFFVRSLLRLGPNNLKILQSK